jgi:hypothetical protein
MRILGQKAHCLTSGQNSFFLVDSGTEMTTMPAAEAKREDLPIPKRSVPGFTFQGLEVRSGLLRAQIPRMDATEYIFPCYFLGDPNARPVRARNLLGLTGVINQIRLTFDGTTSLVAPSGVLVVEMRRRPFQQRKRCSSQELALPVRRWRTGFTGIAKWSDPLSVQ